MRLSLKFFVVAKVNETDKNVYFFHTIKRQYFYFKDSRFYTILQGYGNRR